MTKLKVTVAAIALLAFAACKKKGEEVAPDPETTLEEGSNSAQVFYRPAKVYHSTDSVNFELRVEYTYDAEGRLNTKKEYYPSSDPASTLIEHILAKYSYSPGLLVRKRTFWDIGDKIYYTSGYDSTYLNGEKREGKTNSFFTYHSTASEGIDSVGVKTSKVYSYQKKTDSLQVSIYGDMDYSGTKITQKYMYDGKGALVSFDGYQSTHYPKYDSTIAGRFLDEIQAILVPVYYLELPLSGLVKEVKTLQTDNNMNVLTNTVKWEMDAQKRPVRASCKTSQNYTSYIRLEY